MTHPFELEEFELGDDLISVEGEIVIADNQLTDEVVNVRVWVADDDCNWSELKEPAASKLFAEHKTVILEEVADRECAAYEQWYERMMER